MGVPLETIKAGTISQPSGNAPRLAVALDHLHRAAWVVIVSYG